MQIHITLPSQISIPTVTTKGKTTAATLTCTGVYGMDSTSLNCTGNYTSGKIVIYGAFSTTTTAPSNITFKVASLVNSASSVTTDSFSIKTYNSAGTTLLDSISEYLTVSFNCTSPCKTCGTSATTCTDCQGLSPYKYLINSTCSTSCPSAYYSDSTYQCQECNSPCLTCSGSANTCTSCTSGYTLRGSTCSNYYLFTTQYYFFASGVGVALSILILMCKCCCRKM
jgi:proprotein convertase subtilisin/kexin type 5